MNSVVSNNIHKNYGQNNYNCSAGKYSYSQCQVVRQLFSALLHNQQVITSFMTSHPSIYQAYA